MMQDEQSRSDDISVPAPELGKPTWADTRTAQEEERSWPELGDVKKSNDLRWLKVYGWIVVAITVTFTSIFLASLVIWALHYMLPPSLTWLSEQQLGKMQSVLFSGGMGAVISSVIRHQLGKLKT
ncbi:hypothetical protein [Neopusillimonas aromaticivorans]|uniref:hypothetical protein n=1 Tax=Neopusillimonas aromaticivorans TaxID=2979868 RepID=UPI00259AA9CC|nr:hypothetical protein [Neopusillimonas aromaticivorans]WJJ93418.1 hypothetical protein N7E01_15870 [Neopusillimonas aromaticivorans]